MISAAVAGASADIVFGNGDVQIEQRTVASFSSISVAGSGTLRVHKGGQKVSLKSDSNVLPYITTEVVDGQLRIGFKPFTSLTGTTKLEYEITMPSLRGIGIAGSGEAYVDAFKGETFKADIAGSGAMKADLDYGSIQLNCMGSGGFDAKVKADRLDLRVSGSGDVFIQGSADRAEVRLSGSSSLGAKNFAVGDAKVAVTGSGSVEIKVAKSLDIAISGSGSLKYWGNPVISQRVSGSGQISKGGE